MVLRFGGASKENPGISDGFHGRDLTVGDAPREGTGFLDDVEPTDLLLSEEDDLLREAVTLGTLDGVVVRRVGVDALDVGREVGAVGRDVGVEDLAVDLVGVADLAVDLVGVEDLDGPVDGAKGFVDLDGVDDLDGPADLIEVAEAVGRVDVNEPEGLGEEE